ncbi:MULTISPECIES: UDP-glucose 6-dehydrogenase [unclassified Actinopolyspora]|uniref:UDP-glucose 6-dehydrogenase n=1 Tax=unclassified Actinopolyspora TaxID=2639451 RepID=UPI0013F5B23C|nr:MULTISPECIES: UDP-glucose 6-dehydrogenase [unclassified Actinopolyspora]NHD15797.1 UDP-glucose 6-dehydrogenase [Actinopolyspora sp. BKK2]NHE74989.1 UDP-glucose 6-dehydrogenase [Actinopolyspora sp. BKK1]
MPTVRERPGIAVVGDTELVPSVLTGLVGLGHEVVLTGRDAGEARARGRALPEAAGAGEPDFVFVCGAGDSSEVVAAVRARLRGGGVVVNTCAPPWESTHRLGRWIGRDDLALVSQPRVEGWPATAEEFARPECLVIGSASRWAGEAVAALYRSVAAPVLHTDVNSADLLPHAVNGYAAVKQSFVNSLAELCDRVGADVSRVVEALSYDTRFGAFPTGSAPLSAGQHRSLHELLRWSDSGERLLSTALDEPGS